MDIKSKSSDQNRVFGILLSMILIALISTCVIVSYPLIWKNMQLLLAHRETEWDTITEQQNDLYKREFIRTLHQSNYVLFWNSKQQLVDLTLEPSQIFLSEELQTLSGEDKLYNEKREFVEYFNDILESWYARFFSITLYDYPSFQYYFYDHKTGNTATNAIKPLVLLSQDTDEARELKASYPFYIVFRYSEDGGLQILDYNGLDSMYIDQYKLLELNKSQILQNDLHNLLWNQYRNKIKSPSDVTIIYASTSENFYLPNHKIDYQLSPKSAFSDAGLVYAFCIATVSVFLMAMVLPCKKSWQIGRSFATRIPFEVSVAGIMLAVSSYFILLPIAYETMNGYFISDPQFTIIPGWILKIIDYSINFLLWFMVLVALFLCFVSLRQVFTLGFIRYFKEKTMIGRTLMWFARKIRNMFHTLGEIDLSEPSNKSIIRILMVNFFILLLLCSIWVFGIFLLIIYTIILFFIMRKYFDDIKEKYAILLSATRRIAGGNLEGTIEENLGVFEPLKDELVKVQQGFKKAVEEEIKSQRMKTDLITNVSHDLKTPLTAIITYINLLKDENITDEERKSYIETLDNKSQRLKRLIEDLFEVSKASSNNITLNRMEIDLGNLIQQVLLELDDKITDSNVEFRYNQPDDKIILKLDSEKTYRIFENLIINITKYAMPHTRAYIDIRKKENVVQIILKNVSASEMDFNPEDISERFVRGDKARNTEGSGLGLAIVKSFVELQGGRFKIQTDGDLFKAIIEWKMED